MFTNSFSLLLKFKFNKVFIVLLFNPESIIVFKIISSLKIFLLNKTPSFINEISSFSERVFKLFFSTLFYFN